MLIYAHMTELNHVRLYRVENPTIPAKPDGVISHEAIVGQWFTPNINTATNYLHKATQTFGKDAHPTEGAQLVVTDVPRTDIEGLHVSHHPIASGMDVENDNYIVPPEAGYPRTTIALDETLGDLKGKLGRFDNLMEAKQRVAQVAKELGAISLAHM